MNIKTNAQDITSEDLSIINIISNNINRNIYNYIKEWHIDFTQDLEFNLSDTNYLNAIIDEFDTNTDDYKHDLYKTISESNLFEKLGKVFQTKLDKIIEKEENDFEDFKKGNL